MKQAAIDSGTRAAQQATLFPWGLFGFLLPAITLIIVYLSWPRVPPDVMVSHKDDSTQRLFEEAYIAERRPGRITATWVGVVLGILFVLLFYVVLSQR